MLLFSPSKMHDYTLVWITYLHRLSCGCPRNRSDRYGGQYPHHCWPGF